MASNYKLKFSGAQVDARLTQVSTNSENLTKLETKVNSNKTELSGNISDALKSAKDYTEEEIKKLDATRSQDASSDNGYLQLSITEEDGKVTSLSGSVSHAEAVQSAKDYADAKIAELDTTQSQTASSDNGYLALSVTEEDGKITGISGSVSHTEAIESAKTYTDTKSTQAQNAAIYNAHTYTDDAVKNHKIVLTKHEPTSYAELDQTSISYKNAIFTEEGTYKISIDCLKQFALALASPRFEGPDYDINFKVQCPIGDTLDILTFCLTVQNGDIYIIYVGSDYQGTIYEWVQGTIVNDELSNYIITNTSSSISNCEFMFYDNGDYFTNIINDSSDLDERAKTFIKVCPFYKVVGVQEIPNKNNILHLNKSYLESPDNYTDAVHLSKTYCNNDSHIAIGEYNRPLLNNDQAISDERQLLTVGNGSSDSDISNILDVTTNRVCIGPTSDNKYIFTVAKQGENDGKTLLGVNKDEEYVFAKKLIIDRSASTGKEDEVVAYGDIYNIIDNKISSLEATKSQTASDSNGGLALEITETDGKITKISGSVDHSKVTSNLTSYADMAASGALSAAKTYTDDEIKKLDATKSQTASSSNGYLALSVTETDGKITSISGSVDSSNYQPKLVSGTNIKTINGNSILGTGNIEIQSSGGAAVPERVTFARSMLCNLNGYRAKADSVEFTWSDELSQTSGGTTYIYKILKHNSLYVTDDEKIKKYLTQMTGNDCVPYCNQADGKACFIYSIEENQMWKLQRDSTSGMLCAYKSTNMFSYSVSDKAKIVKTIAWQRDYEKYPGTSNHIRQSGKKEPLLTLIASSSNSCDIKKLYESDNLFIGLERKKRHGWKIASGIEPGTSHYGHCSLITSMLLLSQKSDVKDLLSSWAVATSIPTELSGDYFNRSTDLAINIKPFALLYPLAKLSGNIESLSIYPKIDSVTDHIAELTSNSYAYCFAASNEAKFGHRMDFLASSSRPLRFDVTTTTGQKKQFGHYKNIQMRFALYTKDPSGNFIKISDNSNVLSFRERCVGENLYIYEMVTY